MALFKCKMCGGNLEVTEGMTVCECEYCGTKQTVPTADNDKKLGLFSRANMLRFSNEFDKASALFENIIAEFPAESEAYWGLVLCKFGIEYVDDPATGKKIPTCHRTVLESVFDDPDFRKAMDCADAVAARIYRDEAKEIDRIQQSILSIVKNEKPYDIFICYKETAEDGQRTKDSVMAQDIYDALTAKGYKVFFARITLEDKLGQEYEPYIFAALSSAKIMLSIGTSYDYFNAVWVKNEWSRFLAMMKTDKSKVLIPCYCDCDAYDMPQEFRNLQGQDMGKVGFIQDLVRGIGKIIPAPNDVATQTQPQTIIQQVASSNAENLLKRGMMALEEEKWDEADKFFEQVLNENVEEPRAYYGKMLSLRRTRSEEELIQSAPEEYIPLDNDDEFKKALRFANDEYKAYLIDLNNRYVFSSGMKRFDSAKSEKEYLEAKSLFDKLPDYQPARAKSAECIEKAHEVVYTKTCTILSESEEKTQLLFAISEFSRISDYKDSEQRKAQCEERLIQIEGAEKDDIYNKAINMLASDSITDHELRTALSLFRQIIDWKDSKKYIAECQERINSINAETERKRSNSKQEAEKQRLLEAKKVKKRKILTALIGTSVSLVAVSLVLLFSVIIPNQQYNQKIEAAMLAFEEIEDYPANTISTGPYHTVGIKADGTVLAAGDNKYGQCNVSEWSDIIAVSVGYGHTVGLKSNGTVVAIGENDGGQCNVSDWNNIIAISAGAYYTIGLKSNGTVVATGVNSEGQCDVSEWTNIIAVSACGSHTVGLKSDGTVVAVGNNKYEKCDVSGWTDIIAVSAGEYHVVGLKSDGTVVAVGNNQYEQCNVSEWTDIIAVSADGYGTLGLKADGTVVATGDNQAGQYEEWKAVISISTGTGDKVGLLANGTVIVSTGANSWERDANDWTDMKTTND